MKWKKIMLNLFFIQYYNYVIKWRHYLEGDVLHDLMNDPFKELILNLINEQLHLKKWH